MKKLTLLTAFLYCSFYAPAFVNAQEQTSQATISQLSSSAQEELTKSITKLNALRDEISSEKLPLAQDLSASEEKLTQLRREHEKVARLVDSGNLELTTLKSEMKVRQDEMAYIGNLLDEYSRSFETKIHISELQYLGRPMEAAKQVTENTSLSMPEKFKLQTDFTDLTIKRLFDAIGGMKFSGVGVDSKGVVVDGQYAIIGPVVLFSGKGGASGVAIAQTGSTNPMIRPLEGDIQKRIAGLVDSGRGLMPLDPSRGGAMKAFTQKTDLVHIFKKGGPIMWPLLLAALLALGTVIERLIFLSNEQRKRDPKALENFLSAVSKGDIEGATRMGHDSKFYVVRTLSYALEHREKSLANAILYAQEQELKKFRRGVPVLDTVITLAPLLGLLGTVTGMMGSFSLIGGELSAPGAITGGIAEALIATAFGLGTAITALIPYNYLNTKIEESRLEVELAAKQLELLVHPQSTSSEVSGVTINDHIQLAKES